MKKSAFILTIILSLGSIASAQITLGPKAGYNLSNQNTGSDYEVYKHGIQYGGVVNIPVLDFLSIQGELLITEKGYRQEFNGDAAFDELTSTYIEIPAMVHLFKDGKDFRYFINLGFYNAFWQSGVYTSNIDGSSNVIREDYEFISDPDVNGFKDIRTDLGFVGSIGFWYDNLGSGNIVLDIRYQQGVIPVNSFEVEPQGYVPRKNNTISVSVAYMLFL